MEFGLTDDQKAILATIDRFVETHIPLSEQRRRDAARDPPYGLLRLMGEAGLIALPFPEAYGGLSAPWETVALVQERFGWRAWMAGSLFNRTVGFGGLSLLTYGSEVQKAALLPRLIRGELLFALALTEDGAGSDAAAIRTTATRDGKGWRLDGCKRWISDAEAADFLVVVAREPGTAGPESVTLFLAPKGLDGVSFRRIETVGNNCLPTFEVTFDAARLPADASIGGEGRGFRCLMSTLHFARAGMAAAVTGYAQFAVDLALEHARTRVQFGRPIGTNQAIAHRLADMQMRVDQSRAVARDLARRIAAGAEARRHAAEAKVIATEALQYVTHHGMQILASAAYDPASDMARIWRDARLYSFGEGANEIQRGIVARELGLPV